LDQAEGFVGSAQLRGIFVEDYGDGDIFQEIFEMPFVFEGVEEGTVFHFFEDFNSDAAGHVDAADCEDFEGEIASFGSVDVGPEIDGFNAHGASFVEAVLGDLRSGIGVGIGESSVFDGRIEKFVDGAKAAAGKNQLKTHLRSAAAHETKQFNLLFGVRSEIGVATFGGADLIAGAIPDEKSFAQAGARGEQRTCSADFWRAGIQNGEIGRIEIFDAVSPGAEVVEKNYVFDGQFMGEDSGVNGPGKIGGTDTIVDDGAGDAKACRVDFFVTEMRCGDAGKLFCDEIEGGEILAAETLLENRGESAAFFGKKRKVAFCAADVTGQYHEIPQNTVKQKTPRSSARKIAGGIL
jgi:hypothetical protein